MRGIMLGAAIALAALAPAAQAATCDKRAGTTEYVDAQVRVYTTTSHQTLSVFACRRGRRATQRLERTATNLDSLVSLVAAAHRGRYLMLQMHDAGGTFDRTSFVEYLLGGRRIATMTLDPDSDNVPASSTTAPFYDFWLTRDGGLAILYGDAADAFLVGYDAAGRHQLATAPTDVAAAGDTVYWTADAPQSATLHGHPTGDVAP